jgi:transposase
VSYFAGLDVSLEETAICIVDDAGKIVREARAASEPEALVAFSAECEMTMEHVGLEACSLTAWLTTALTEAGVPAICIEARRYAARAVIPAFARRVAALAPSVVLDVRPTGSLHILDQLDEGDVDLP